MRKESVCRSLGYPSPLVSPCCRPHGLLIHQGQEEEDAGGEGHGTRGGKWKEGRISRLGKLQEMN